MSGARPPNVGFYGSLPSYHQENFQGMHTPYVGNERVRPYLHDTHACTIRG